VPGLFIDGLEQIERIQKEMTRAARRVQNLDVAGILRRAIRLSRVVGDEEFADFRQSRIAAPNFPPRSAERVVDKKADDIARSEELIWARLL
jgi:hypothetical protein